MAARRVHQGLGKPFTLGFGGNIDVGGVLDQCLEHSLEDRVCERAARKLRLQHPLLERTMRSPEVWGNSAGALQADVSIASLVSPLTFHPHRARADTSRIVHAAHPLNVEVLEDINLDVAVLGNQFSMAYQEQGLMDTRTALAAVKVKYCGAGHNLAVSLRPTIVKVLGRNIAVFSISTAGSGLADASGNDMFEADERRAGVAYFDIWDVREQEAVLSELRELVELAARASRITFVVFSVCWGSDHAVAKTAEGQRMLTSEVPAAMRAFARGLVDVVGAHVVHGHGPSHLMGAEVYRGRPILYSCGTLVGDGGEAAARDRRPAPPRASQHRRTAAPPHRRVHAPPHPPAPPISSPQAGQRVPIAPTALPRPCSPLSSSAPRCAPLPPCPALPATRAPRPRRPRAGLMGGTGPREEAAVRPDLSAFFSLHVSGLDRLEWIEVRLLHLRLLQTNLASGRNLRWAQTTFQRLCAQLGTRAVVHRDSVFIPLRSRPPQLPTPPRRPVRSAEGARPRSPARQAPDDMDDSARAADGAEMGMAPLEMGLSWLSGGRRSPPKPSPRAVSPRAVSPRRTDRGDRGGGGGGGGGGGRARVGPEEWRPKGGVETDGRSDGDDDGSEDETEQSPTLGVRPAWEKRWGGLADPAPPVGAKPRGVRSRMFGGGRGRAWAAAERQGGGGGGDMAGARTAPVQAELEVELTDADAPLRLLQIGSRRSDHDDDEQLV